MHRQLLFLQCEINYGSLYYLLINELLFAYYFYKVSNSVNICDVYIFKFPRVFCLILKLLSKKSFASTSFLISL